MCDRSTIRPCYFQSTVDEEHAAAHDQRGQPPARHLPAAGLREVTGKTTAGQATVSAQKSKS